MTAKDLKNALLQEAVQGKLVPQIASEGNARDLLEEIRKKKLSHGLDFPNGKSVKKKSKTETALAGSNPCDITEDEIPFEIPESWCWCRVGDIFQHNTGKAMNSSAKEINKSGAIRKFITTSNLYWNEFDFTNVKEMFFSDDELPRCTVTKGDILINEGGAYFGRTAIWNYGYDICFQNHIHRLRPYSQIERKFFYYIFYLYRNTNRMQSKGTAMPGLSSEVLHSTIIPLAPLAEQKRIVAAIEKFMPLIEEYGKKETELKAFNEQIGTLTKKAILQEAVQGKLVPQIAAEGNARDLLEEIKKEKAKVAGKASSTSFASKTRAKEFPPITDDEIPFDIPENWCWCRLGYICQLIDGEKVQNVNLPLLDAKYLRGKKQAEFLSVGKLAQINDLLILVDGENSGEVFINKEKGIMGSTFKKLIINKKLYLPYVLAFISMNKDLLRNSKKGAAIPHLNKDIFFGLLLFTTTRRTKTHSRCNRKNAAVVRKTGRINYG